jgi:hypothetical protein
LLSPAGGDQEPPLKDGIENPESTWEVLPKAGNPSKTDTGLIITSIVLGVVLAVSVLGNFVLLNMRKSGKNSNNLVGIEVQTPMPEVVAGENKGISKKLDVALKAISTSHPDETTIIRRVIDQDMSYITQKCFIIARMTEWLQKAKMYVQKILDRGDLSSNIFLEQLVNNDISYFQTKYPPGS